MTSMKRPLASEEGTEPPSKLSKAELYRPPTNDELNQLRETENLYQNSLFRLQIKELLGEVTIKEKRRRQITEWVEGLKRFLTNLKHGKEKELMDQSWCGDVRVPLDQPGPPVKGVYTFHPPLDVATVGAFQHGTAVKPCVVDVHATMPKACFQQSDFMNHRYHRKRALYLVSLARHLRKFPGVETTEFSYLHGNRWKPVLVLTPSGKLGGHVTVRLLTSVEAGAFKLSRFHVCKNSVRTKWWSGGDMTEVESDPATPYYNTAVLQDLLTQTTDEFISDNLEEQAEVQQGLVLVKVWARQRGLDRVGGLTGHMLTMYVIHLLRTRKLNKLMSSYQVFRNTLLHLGQSELDQGESLCQSPPDDAPSMDDFLASFPLVLVDPSGWLNLASGMEPCIYEWLKEECRQAIHILETERDSFQALFMTSMPFLHSFHYVFHLRDTKCLESCVSKFGLARTREDRHDVVSATLRRLVELLRQGLGERVTLMAHQNTGIEKWAVTSPYPDASESKITFGFNVNPDHYTSLIDKGPPADSTEAAEFQRFWGERSELRRFQDASIREAVVWTAETLAQRRTVCLQIVRYVLDRHAGIAPTENVDHCDKLDPLLQPAQAKHKTMVYGTGEEQTLSVLKAFEAVSQNVRKLRDLPLSIDAVRGAAPVFSYSEVFPSLLYTKGRVSHQEPPLREGGRPVPPYQPVMDVVCSVEGSGQWPEDREAIRWLKAAFYIKLAESLHSLYSVTSYAHSDHVTVVQDGHLFRLVLAVKREIAVLKMVHKKNGMLKMVDTDEAVKLETDVIKRPLIRSSLHGVQLSHNTFTLTCRLLKRWLAAQMLSRYVDDVIMDLLAAYVYVHPSPYTPPRSAFTGFLRVLKLLCSWDWKLNPLVINFNNAISSSELDELYMTFSRERASLPLMFIASPHDLKSTFTKHGPIVPVLHRIVTLAQQALTTLEEQYDNINNSNFKLIFRPSLAIYDVTIHCDVSMVPRAFQAVDPPGDNRPSLGGRVADRKLMVTAEFDPVQCYLKELEAAYGKLALFCHDPLGGAVIGVLWKPGTMGEKEFKISHMPYHKIDMDSDSNSPTLQPNLEAILEDFRILGQGLVSEVKVKS